MKLRPSKCRPEGGLGFGGKAVVLDPGVVVDCVGNGVVGAAVVVDGVGVVVGFSVV